MVLHGLAQEGPATPVFAWRPIEMSGEPQVKTLAFLCTQIRCETNRAQFQHARYLCNNYRVHIFSHGRVCQEINARAERVHTFSASRRWLPRVFFTLWLFLQVWRLQRREGLALVYTGPHSQPVIAGYLLRLSGLRWVADFWDEPHLAADVRRGSPGEKSSFRFYDAKTISQLASVSGFQVLRITSPPHRLSYAELSKPRP